MYEQTAATAPTTRSHHGEGQRAGHDRRPCVDCGRPLCEDETDRFTCRPCQGRAARRLLELADLLTRLNTATALAPTSGQRSGGDTPNAGRAHAPLPVRVDVLDLTGPGGLYTRLQAIVDAWRAARSLPLHPVISMGRVYPYWRPNAAHSAARHLKFLGAHLTWACTEYPEIGQDLTEIHHIHRAATTALDPTPPGRTGRVHIGRCPVTGPDNAEPCGTRLTADTTTRTATCHTCHTTWAGDDELRALRTAQRELNSPSPELTAATAA